MRAYQHVSVNICVKLCQASTLMEPSGRVLRGMSPTQHDPTTGAERAGSSVIRAKALHPT